MVKNSNIIGSDMYVHDVSEVGGGSISEMTNTSADTTHHLNLLSAYY